jgi:hypothetical protein
MWVIGGFLSGNGHKQTAILKITLLCDAKMG